MKKVAITLYILLSVTLASAYPYPYKTAKTISEVLEESLNLFRPEEEEDYSYSEEYIEPSDDLFSLLEIVNGNIVMKKTYRLTTFEKP